MSASGRRFWQVDVFTHQPLMGNPVAVVLDAEGLESEAMQRMAAWTNLSETTFVLPPTQSGADYRLRIFTPKTELLFAGHPTLGSAHAVLEAGFATDRDGALVQECGAGLIPLRIEDSGALRTLSALAPAARFREVVEQNELRMALGGVELKGVPQVVDVGPKWLIADLGDERVVRSMAPLMDRLARYTQAHDVIGVTVFGRAKDEAFDLVVRSFVPADGIPEDPVCGSGNASVRAYLHRRKDELSDLPQLLVSQGREVGRDGRVTLKWDAASDRAIIGGGAVTTVSGTLHL